MARHCPNQGPRPYCCPPKLPREANSLPYAYFPQNLAQNGSRRALPRLSAPTHKFTRNIEHARPTHYLAWKVEYRPLNRSKLQPTYQVPGVMFETIKENHVRGSKIHPLPPLPPPPPFPTPTRTDPFRGSKLHPSPFPPQAH